MKEFEYTITDELGIHARPAGLLVKKAAEFASTEGEFLLNKTSSVARAGQKKEGGIFNYDEVFAETG